MSGVTNQPSSPRIPSQPQAEPVGNPPTASEGILTSDALGHILSFLNRDHYSEAVVVSRDWSLRTVDVVKVEENKVMKDALDFLVLNFKNNEMICNYLNSLRTEITSDLFDSANLLDIYTQTDKAYNKIDALLWEIGRNDRPAMLKLKQAIPQDSQNKFLHYVKDTIQLVEEANHFDENGQRVEAATAPYIRYLDKGHYDKIFRVLAVDDFVQEFHLNPVFPSLESHQADEIVNHVIISLANKGNYKQLLKIFDFLAQTPQGLAVTAFTFAHQGKIAEALNKMSSFESHSSDGHMYQLPPDQKRSVYLEVIRYLEGSNKPNELAQFKAAFLKEYPEG